jgi:hypothetical protein
VLDYYRLKSWCCSLQSLPTVSQAARPPAEILLTHEAAGDEGLKLSLALRYRCDFGQHLCVVGGSERLGQWDLQLAPQMTWTEGDVWVLEISLPAKWVEFHDHSVLLVFAT